MTRTCALGCIALLLLLAPVAGAQSLAGTWQGALTVDTQSFRLGLVVSATGQGYDAYLVVIDQDGARVPIESVVVDGNAVRLAIPAAGGTYEGTLGSDGQGIAGFLIQDEPRPLDFARVEALDDPPTFDETAEAAVRAAVDGYFATFTAEDWEGFREVVQAPFTLWAVGGAPDVLTDAAQVVERMRGIREALRSTDYAVSRAERVIITPLTATSALADIHWQRDNQDGSLMVEAAEILVVVRSGDTWRVAGNVARALSQFGRTF